MTVELAGLTLPSPVLVASGCGGTGRELAAYGDPAALGGFVTRTLTLDPRPGRPGPRVQEADSGFVRAAGVPDSGVERFLTGELPWLAQHGVRTFASVHAGSLGEYAELTRRLAEAPGLSGLEVDLAHEPDGFDTREPFQAARVVAAVRRELPRGRAVLAKLGHDPVRLVELARTAVEAGADGVVLGHGVPALTADGRPGWLTGPATRPVALRSLAELAAALPEVVVVAGGGIGTTDDARACLAAGATAVQVGSALLHDPTAAHRIARDLTDPTTTHPAEEGTA